MRFLYTKKFSIFKLGGIQVENHVFLRQGPRRIVKSVSVCVYVCGGGGGGGHELANICQCLLELY